MKKLSLVAMVLAGLASLPALAVGTNTVTGTFTVTVNVTSACKISSSPTAMTFNYQSLQTGAAYASGSFDVTCTNQLPYTAGLDAYSVTDANNLTYTLNVGQVTKPTGATYTAAAPLQATGSGLAQTISIDGAMAGNQSGTCANATCNSTTSRTLTITY